MKLSSKLKIGIAALAGSSVIAFGSEAVTGTFTVTVTFTQPLSITQTRAADFGRLYAGAATTYSLSTASIVTAGPGGSATGGTPASGRYRIADAAGTGDLHITVHNPIPDAGVTITGFLCDYNGGALIASGATCTLNNASNPGPGGMNLLVGFNINVDGTQVHNSVAHPTFDITAIYE